MAIERTAPFVSLAINLVTLSFLVLQTRYLARQTTSLNRSLEHTAYLKLVDYLNKVNLLLFQQAALVGYQLGVIPEAEDGPGPGPWPVDGRGAPSGACGRLSRRCTPSSSPTT